MQAGGKIKNHAVGEAGKDLQRFRLLQAAQVGSVLLEKGSSSQEGSGFSVSCGSGSALMPSPCSWNTEYVWRRENLVICHFPAAFLDLVS